MIEAIAIGILSWGAPVGLGIFLAGLGILIAGLGVLFHSLRR